MTSKVILLILLSLLESQGQKEPEKHSSPVAEENPQVLTGDHPGGSKDVHGSRKPLPVNSRNTSSRLAPEIPAFALSSTEVPMATTAPS